MDMFRLDDKVAIITGGAGLLGVQHAEAIAKAGGCPILWDIDECGAIEQAEKIQKEFNVDSMGMKVDITNREDVKKGLADIIATFNRIDILINNAANNPKVKMNDEKDEWSRFEHFSIEQWNQDIAVGLTGAFLCTQIIGTEMAKCGGGVILNISSDLGIIAPDQRLYSKEGLPDNQQPVKPVSYSVVKTALLGLTRYTATYWAGKKIRVNAICPGGIQTGQPDDFLEKIQFRIPMGRMARKDEYKGVVLFLLSDASSYMNGSTIIIDGGRTCW